MYVENNILALLIPEAVLLIGAMWLFIVAGTTTMRGAGWNSFWALFALALYAVAGVGLFSLDVGFWNIWNGFAWEPSARLTAYGAGAAMPPSGPLAIDLLGDLVRWLGLLIGVVVSLMVVRPQTGTLVGERLGVVMLATIGVMLVGSSNDLVLTFVGLELISIPTYVLLFFGPKRQTTAEATAKYFFLSIFSSAILLYGFSFLYGIAGSTYFGDIRAAFAEGGSTGLLSLAPVAVALVVAGLGFKIAAAPFHFYAPDVYQGASNAGAAFLATAPKLAGIVVLARLVALAMPSNSPYMWQLIYVVSILTMTLGNISALWQTNVRRLLAYSSIAHSGYMLIGLAVALSGNELMASQGGIGGMLLYTAMYVVASLGSFAVLSWLSTDENEIADSKQLAGLLRTRPTAALLLAVCLFSLAGIPPLAGFWGKFGLFSGAINHAANLWQTDSSTAFWFLSLAFIGAINAAIAAGYYLRIIAIMFFRPSTQEIAPGGGWMGASAMAIPAVLALFLGIAPGGITKVSSLAENSARSTAVGAEYQIVDPRIGLNEPAVDPISTVEPQQQ
ncbi:MAG: NADH-quinone oxidoreductase subunit N [bacterium]|nr:NADH-quinone oxidoreductase subunit N [bacterium]